MTNDNNDENDLLSWHFDRSVVLAVKAAASRGATTVVEMMSELEQQWTKEDQTANNTGSLPFAQSLVFG